jgi:hypothetical protein
MARSHFDQVVDVAMGHLLPRCLHAVVELGVADHIGDAPMSAEALAEATGANADALDRILRLLASAGIFEPRGKLWAHTERSRILRSDHPRSLQPYLRWLGARMTWHCIGELQHSLRTGRPVFEKFRSGGTWDYFRDNPEAGRAFDAAMESRAREEIAALVDAFDFTRYGVIADIGGGRGHILAAVLDASPGAKGVLFDQPAVVAAVEPHPRMSLQGGDFLEGPLPAADAYIVGHVLHNWADEQAQAILRSILRSAPAKAELLVLESLVPEGIEPHRTKVVDIQMMLFNGGRERTRPEYESLFAAAGFRVDRIVPTSCPTSIMVGVPI